MLLIIIFVTMIVLRLATIPISVKNEKAMKKNGAVEYGKKTSTVFMMLMQIFYWGCLAELIITKPDFNNISIIGICIWVLSMVVLVYVLKSMGRFWTVKLIIADDHELSEGFLFKFFRHPNYYLNMFPEFVAIALITQSWRVSAVMIPLIVINIVVRIFQEEKVMKEKFVNY